MSLHQTVQTNLVHYNKWTDVDAVVCGEYTFLKGNPPEKLDERDTPGQPEWVVPLAMTDQNVSTSEIDKWFCNIALVAARPARVTLALVNTDGTVVYYFVHDGIVKPRQN